MKLEDFIAACGERGGISIGDPLNRPRPLAFARLMAPGRLFFVELPATEMQHGHELSFAKAEPFWELGISFLDEAGEMTAYIAGVDEWPLMSARGYDGWRMEFADRMSDPVEREYFERTVREEMAGRLKSKDGGSNVNGR